MYEDYYCNIEIYLIESLNELRNIWYQETGNVTRSDTLKGIHSYKQRYEIHLIWILAGNHSDYSTQGCTVLWHELLHVYGYSNKDMPYCSYPNKYK